MNLVVVGPKIEKEDVDLMLKRVGIGESVISEVMGESEWVLSVRQRGNYTVAMVTTKSFPTAMGVAKRNPVDRECDKAGACLAMRRCFEEVKDLKGGSK